MRNVLSSVALVLALGTAPAFAGGPATPEDRRLAQDRLQRVERAVEQARPRGPVRTYATLAERHVALARRALDRGAVGLANVLLRNAEDFLALAEGRPAALPPPPFPPAEVQR